MIAKGCFQGRDQAWADRCHLEFRQRKAELPELATLAKKKRSLPGWSRVSQEPWRVHRPRLGRENAAFHVSRQSGAAWTSDKSASLPQPAEAKANQVNRPPTPTKYYVELEDVLAPLTLSTRDFRSCFF